MSIKSIRTELLALACVFVAAGWGEGGVALGDPPNLVIFISDDHGYLDSALAGAGGFRTPNLAPGR